MDSTKPLSRWLPFGSPRLLQRLSSVSAEKCGFGRVKEQPLGPPRQNPNTGCKRVRKTPSIVLYNYRILVANAH